MRLWCKNESVKTSKNVLNNLKRSHTVRNGKNTRARNVLFNFDHFPATYKIVFWNSKFFFLLTPIVLTRCHCFCQQYSSILLSYSMLNVFFLYLYIILSVTLIRFKINGLCTQHSLRRYIQFCQTKIIFEALLITSS